MNLIFPIRKSALCRIPVSLVILIILILPPGLIPAQPPSWWQARGVLKAGATADDYSVINQGQLKNLVRAAVQEFDVALAGGAGDILEQLVLSWATSTSQADDYAAVNVGQLKAVATPIYDRLISVRLATGYPWNDPAKFQDDYSMANIGQAKKLFAFDAKSGDTDGDGIPDWWEIKYGLSPYNPMDGGADADGDGWTNKQEWLTGGDPTDAASGPSFPAAQAFGNGNEDERISKQVTVTLPAGNQTYIVIVAVQTAEYPHYTSNQSEFNDLVDWNITPAGATPIQGTTHVNSLHSAFRKSEEHQTTILGLEPYAIAANGIVQSNPSSTTQVQIEVGATNISDGILPTTVIAALLPIEVRASQFAHGPHGSPPMYQDPTPLNGQPVAELFSAWPNEKITFAIGHPLGALLQRKEIPAISTKWTGDNLVEKIDMAVFDAQWATTGMKQVHLQIGASVFDIHINVPNTGKLDLINIKLINEIGFATWKNMGFIGRLAAAIVKNKYGVDGASGPTRQDAIRHSTWNAACAAKYGKEKTLKLTTGNEYTGQYSEKALASNTTMDLHNNEVGADAGVTHLNDITPISVHEMVEEMEIKYDNAMLWAWTPPEATVTKHANIIRKSNQTKIFSP